MDAQVHAQGRSMAVRRGTEADPQTHLQGLYRKLAGRAARTGTRLRPDQHRRVQRPAAHHHGLAGRQAQRRRFDTPCIVGTVPQARGGILAPPRRRRHLDGRYLYPPRAAGTRRTRSLRNFGQRGRTRRRRAAEHRHGPRTGLRRPLRRGREDHRRQEEGRTRTASAARPQGCHPPRRGTRRRPLVRPEPRHELPRRPARGAGPPTRTPTSSTCRSTKRAVSRRDSLRRRTSTSSSSCCAR